MAINKVVYGSTTLIDLTADTVTVSDVVSGVTFHLRDGSIGTGTMVNGDALGYGFATNNIAGVAIVGSAILSGSLAGLSKAGNAIVGG